MSFFDELTALLNRHNQENGSDTPDWMLAEYLLACLQTWNATIQLREKWYGRSIGRGRALLPAHAPDIPQADAP
jgi:hypothetical protein